MRKTLLVLFNRLSLAAGGLLLTQLPVVGQTLLHHIEGLPDEYGFGNGVIALGDVTDDGVPDFAVNIAFDSPTRAVAVYDSASGQRLYRIEVPKEKTGYDVSGRRLARLGDVNGDGSADFGIGIPHTLASRGRSGILRIYNGADGELIREHSETIERSDFAGSLMGQHSAGLGDIDGDGIPDYGSMAGSGGGQEARLTVRVRLFSGASGQEIAALKSDREMVEISDPYPAGDFNRDGTPDIMVKRGSGAIIDAVIVSGMVRGDVTIFDNAPEVLKVIPAGDGSWLFSKSPLADVNADGTPDLLVNTGTHSAQVISGVNGRTLHTGPPGEYPDRYSRSQVGVGDIDRDGHDDFAYGLSTWRLQNLEEVHLSVFSGRTFQPILRIVPTVPVTRSFSEVVDVLGDINQDGYPELLIGVGRRESRSHPTDFRGYVDVVSLVPPSCPIPKIRSFERVESGSPFLQRWQINLFSDPGSFYRIEFSQDLETWSSGEPFRALGTSTRAPIDFPNTWKRGYFRVVETE